MKNFVKRITSVLLSSCVLCGVSLFSGCLGDAEKRPSGIINLTSAGSSTDDTSSANIPEPLDEPMINETVVRQPAAPDALLDVPSNANIYIRSLSEALAHFSEIESKTAEGTPEEIVKTLLERNILCFATMQGKCWTYDEEEYGYNYEFSNGIIPIQSDYLSSAGQIDDLFYGTYIESKADYLIHYDDIDYPEDTFDYEGGQLYADFSQILKTAMNSFETPTYAAIISSSSDEIVFGRYYSRYPEEGALQPNNYHFRAVKRGGKWRLENYIIDVPAYSRQYDNLIQTNRAGYPEIEEIAMTEVGNFGGEPYWSWYGYEYQIEWCAAFVSWCYYQAGQVNGPFFAAVNSEGIYWFKKVGQWAEADYRDIAPGDSIFFDWDLDGSANHVGLVIGTDGEKVYTIEGNRSDACQQFEYDLDDPHIFGYGLMYWS